MCIRCYWYYPTLDVLEDYSERVWNHVPTYLAIPDAPKSRLARIYRRWNVKQLIWYLVNYLSHTLLCATPFARSPKTILSPGLPYQDPAWLEITVLFFSYGSKISM